MKLSCDEIQELVPAYVIGALDAEELKAFEASLAACPESVAELGDYEALTQALLFSAPPMTPPANLIGNVLKNSSRKPTPMPKTTTTTPISSNIQSMSKTTSANRANSPRLWWSVAAALLVLVLGSNFYWSSRVQSLEDENRELAQVDDLEFLNLLASGSPSQVQLSSARTELASSTSTLSWAKTVDQENWVAWFVIKALPNTEVGQTYQLWLEREGEDPVEVGTVTVDANGNASVIFEITEPLDSFDFVEVRVPEEEEIIFSAEF